MLYLVIGFLIFGLIMIYDASVVVANDNFGDQFRFVKYHLIWVTLGLIAGYVAYKFDYHRLPKIIPYIIITTIILLVVILFVGEDVNGAKRWFDLGTLGIRFQPSELAKLAFIIYLASWLSRERTKTTTNFTESIKHHLTHDLGAFLLLLGFVSFLIVLEPDLGTAMLITATSLAIYFISSRGALHNIGTGFIIGMFVLMGIFASILAPYRIQRVQTFLHFITTAEFDQERANAEDYQLKQVITAVGSGGLTGVGFGQSKQKFFYLVDITPFTDNIFAVYAEEFGYLGSVVLIGLYLLFATFGIRIAKNAPDKLGFLLASGVTFWISFQALIHIAANSAIIPLTGITLPLVSYGGSSTIVVLTGIGLLLNVSKFEKNS